MKVRRRRQKLMRMRMRILLVWIWRCYHISFILSLREEKHRRC